MSPVLLHGARLPPAQRINHPNSLQQQELSIRISFVQFTLNHLSNLARLTNEVWQLGPGRTDQSFVIRQPSGKGFSHADAVGVVVAYTAWSRPTCSAQRKSSHPKITDKTHWLLGSISQITTRASGQPVLHTTSGSNDFRDVRPSNRLANNVRNTGCTARRRV
jgi:hypothetical protein